MTKTEILIYPLVIVFFIFIFIYFGWIVGSLAVSIPFVILMELRQKKLLKEYSDSVIENSKKNIQGWKKVNSLASRVVEYSEDNKESIGIRKEHIKELIKQKEKITKNPDFLKLKSLPNIGNLLAMILIKEYGSLEKLKHISDVGLASTLKIRKKRAEKITNDIRNLNKNSYKKMPGSELRRIQEDNS